jgi:hypothetical protein
VDVLAPPPSVLDLLQVLAGPLHYSWRSNCRARALVIGPCIVCKGEMSSSGIEHQIDLIPDATLRNHAAYRTNPEETKKIQRQVQDLLDREYVRESLSPCAVPILFFPKKDGTWRMCVDCRAINNITIRYHHLIPRIDNMLDELCGSIIFTKIDLRSCYHQI